MTNRNTILNELVDLGSTLAHHTPGNCYAVPQGYFDSLATQIMNRIKASEAADASKEMEYLSPMLSHVSRETPYKVPVGYFGSLDENILEKIREHADYQTSEEETETLSPLLSSLRNKNPYTVPAGYFENLETGIKKKETKIVSITSRRWYRLAAAAVVAGIIVIGGLFFLNGSKVDPNKKPDEWIAKNVVKKVNAEKIDELVTLADEEDGFKTNTETDEAKQAEIKELMKDVSEKEIQDFLNDAVALESNDAADMLMNE
jgi:hypothetical protein